MRLTCARCQREIPGAYRISGVNLSAYAFIWTSAPDVIAAHESECRDA